MRVVRDPCPGRSTIRRSEAYRRSARSPPAGTILSVGWLDLELVSTADELSGVTEICLTKLDILRDWRKCRSA